MWKQFNAAKNGIELSSQINENDLTNNTALAIPNSNMSFLERIKRKFRKEPTLPLQLDEVQKVTLEWLVKQVPTSMLQKIEDERLEKEGKKPAERYIPDARYPIYEALKNASCEEYEEEKAYVFNYIDRFGIKKCLRIEDGEISVTNEAGEKTQIEMRFPFHVFPLVSSLEYATMLDDITGSKLLQEVLWQAEDVIEKAAIKFEDELIEKSIFYFQREGTFKKLSGEREKMRKEILEDKKNFKALEERRRKQFYEAQEKHEFIKQYGTNEKTRRELPGESTGELLEKGETKGREEDSDGR